MAYNKSPIYYTGNKHKLLPQIEKFIPQDIDTFYDIFGGSGTMAINMVTRSNRVVYNEFDQYVFNLFNYYKDTHPDEVHERTLKEAKKWGLPVGSGRNYNEAVTSEHNKLFKTMEKDYLNDRKSSFKHHMLKQYSFSNTIAFNEDGFTKCGFGNRYYKPNIMRKNMYALYNQPITAYNGSFVDFIDKEFNENDFIYLDPPYYNTNANYNDGWTMELENMLLDWLDNLTEKGIKWALSNVFEHKGKVNQHLKDWAKKGGYDVFYPHVQYAAMGSGDGNSGTVECFITNYDPVGVGSYTEQLSLDL